MDACSRVFTPVFRLLQLLFWACVWGWIASDPGGISKAHVAAFATARGTTSITDVGIQSASRWGCFELFLGVIPGRSPAKIHCKLWCLAHFCTFAIVVATISATNAMCARALVTIVKAARHACHCLAATCLPCLGWQLPCIVPTVLPELLSSCVGALQVVLICTPFGFC
jgi:hypothetical protein